MFELNIFNKFIALRPKFGNGSMFENWFLTWKLTFGSRYYFFARKPVWFCEWFKSKHLSRLPSGGIGTFGPLIIKGFGFNQFETLLFNIPFAAFQVVITLLCGLFAQKLKLKWPIVFFLCLPPIGGASALLVLGRTSDLKNKLLGCYYVVSSLGFHQVRFLTIFQLSFFSAIQPMLYSWSSQNTAGHTKKLCTTGMIFVAQCAGNVGEPHSSCGPIFIQMH